MLEKRAWEFKDTPEIGRTHGIHAEPITFGLKVANWYAENRRDAARFPGRRAANGRGENFRRGRHLHASRPGNRAENLPAAGPRHRAHHLAGDRARPPRAISFGAGDCRRVARARRAGNPPPAAHRSARSRGAVRRRAARQLGDAAQTQSRRERTDLRPRARGAREFASRRMENIALWHERDISHSSVERIILPDSTILVDYMLHRTSGNRREHESVSRAHAAESGRDAGPGFFRAAFAGSGRARRAARRRLQMGAGPRHGRVGIGNQLSRSASPPIRTSANSSTKKPSRTLSICSASCAPSTRFSTASSARNAPPLVNARPRTDSPPRHRNRREPSWPVFSADSASLRGAFRKRVYCTRWM